MRELVIGRRATGRAIAPQRARRAERARWLNSPWGVAGLVALVYLIIVVPRLPGGSRDFIHIGRKFLDKAHSSSVIKPSLGYESKVGYDGQFYYFIAVDPVHAKDYMDLPPAYRYSRIVYPMLTRAASAGQPGAIPYLMILINVAAATGGTLALAILLRRRRLSPRLALLYGFFPGLVFAVFRDLTEPLAYAFALSGLLVFSSRSRWRLPASAVLFALGGLTRETAAVFPGILAVSLLIERRPAGGDWLRRLGTKLARVAAFALASLGPLVAWRLAVAQIFSGSSAHGTEGVNGFLSLQGSLTRWPWSRPDLQVVLTVVLPALVFTLAALVCLLKTPTAPELWLVVANVAVSVIFVVSASDLDYGGAGRSAIGAMAATLVAVPRYEATFQQRWARLRWSLVLWSLPFYFVLSVLLGVNGPSLTR
jgi:hypothetical protein